MMTTMMVMLRYFNIQLNVLFDFTVILLHTVVSVVFLVFFSFYLVQCSFFSPFCIGPTRSVNKVVCVVNECITFGPR